MSHVRAQTVNIGNIGPTVIEILSAHHPYPTPAQPTDVSGGAGGKTENLAADGWAVGVHYARSADAAQTLCADIEKRGGRALPLQADLSEADATTRLIPQLAEVFGPVSLLY